MGWGGRAFPGRGLLLLWLCTLSQSHTLQFLTSESIFGITAVVGDTLLPSPWYAGLALGSLAPGIGPRVENRLLSHVTEGAGRSTLPAVTLGRTGVPLAPKGLASCPVNVWSCSLGTGADGCPGTSGRVWVSLRPSLGLTRGGLSGGCKQREPQQRPI